MKYANKEECGAELRELRKIKIEPYRVFFMYGPKVIA